MGRLLGNLHFCTEHWILQSIKVNEIAIEIMPFIMLLDRKENEKILTNVSEPKKGNTIKSLTQKCNTYRITSLQFIL